MPDGSVDCSGFVAKEWEPRGALPLQVSRTDTEGQVTFARLPPGCYVVRYEHYPLTDPQCVAVGAGCAESVCFHLPLDVRETTVFKSADCQDLRCPQPSVGDRAHTLVTFNGAGVPPSAFSLSLPPGVQHDDTEREPGRQRRWPASTAGRRTRRYSPVERRTAAKYRL